MEEFYTSESIQGMIDNLNIVKSASKLIKESEMSQSSYNSIISMLDNYMRIIDEANGNQPITRCYPNYNDIDFDTFMMFIEEMVECMKIIVEEAKNRRKDD